MINVAYFVSPHGFGHAARACAVMEALSNLVKDICFEIFTTAPEWFFADSLTGQYHYHSEMVDVGLIQTTPLVEDLPATVKSLQHFSSIFEETTARLTLTLRACDCRFIICDISPLGIEVARKLGIPSILIENFTWDWIYEGYLSQEPSFSKLIPIFREIFNSPTYHIQTQPLASENPDSLAVVPPISRSARQSRQQTRLKLEISPDQKVILVNLAGLVMDFSILKDYSIRRNVVLLMPNPSPVYFREGNLIHLPHHSSYYHPNLIAASDAVIGKIGYSTLAEAYQAGIPYGFIPRQHFRESPVLEQFIQNNMPSISISQADLHLSRLIDKLEQLLALSSVIPKTPNGALEVAQLIKTLDPGLG